MSEVVGDVQVPPRILLVKLGPIGDVVMASPILDAAARMYPGSKVTWLVGESLDGLVSRMLPAPEILTVDDRTLWQGSTLARTGLILDLWRRTAGRRFEIGLFAHANRRLRPLIWATRVADWRSFIPDEARKPPLPGRRHHHEHVRLLTGQDDGSAMSGRYPKVVLKMLPPTLVVPPGSVAICPGGAKNPLREDVLRRWPVEHYVAVARELLRLKIPVVLAGGPDDAWVRPGFAGLPVIDRIGSTSVAETVDLFAGMAAVIAHDSGPMHLADLAGAPVLGLFGPTNPNEKGPIGSCAQTIWGGGDLACRPCYDGITYAPCTNNRCLREVSPERVIKAVLELMRQAHSPT